MNETLALLRQLMQQAADMADEFSPEEMERILAIFNRISSAIVEQEDSVPSVPNVPIEPAMPVGTDLLWILSGGQPNAFVSYLRTYPGDGFRHLLANPEQLAQTIAYLQQNNPIAEAGQAADGIPNSQLGSSNVVGMKYDKNSGKLLVKFHGNRREPVYQYDGVPPQIFQLLEHGNAFARTKGRNRWGEWWPMKNPSLGASVNQYLKAGGYPYQRIR